MTMLVLGGSVLMFGIAVGCGERASTRAPSPSSALPTSSGEHDQGKTEAEELGIELHVPDVVREPIAASEPVVEEPVLSFEPELFEVDGISLGRLVIATGVEGREPVGAGTSFEPGQRIHAFLEARNATDEDAELYLTFEGPDSLSVGHVTLDVPAHAPRWRTWGYSRVVNEPGEWEAIVTTIDGQEIGRARFQIDG
jgi:hypothetical protein